MTMMQLEIERMRTDAKDREERMRTDAKDRETRYKTELEAQLQRERLAHEKELERDRMQTQLQLAQIEQQGRAVRSGGRALDAELVQKFTSMFEKISDIEERLSEREDEDEERESTAMVVQAPPPDPVTKIVETITPIVQMLMEKLTDGSKIVIPNIAPPSDPSNKPN